MRPTTHVASTILATLIGMACGDDTLTRTHEDFFDDRQLVRDDHNQHHGRRRFDAHTRHYRDIYSQLETATTQHDSSPNAGDAGDDAPTEAQSTTDESADASNIDGSVVDTDAATSGSEPPDNDANIDAGDAAAPNDGGVRDFGNQCAAIPLSCGDHVQNDTSDIGINLWQGYASSQRAEDGKEVLYALALEPQCHVTVVMSDLTSDLDLFLLEECTIADSTTFEVMDSQQASSTPIDLQTIEQLTFSADGRSLYYVVVEGYNGDEGSYTLDIECNCDSAPAPRP